MFRFANIEFLYFIALVPVWLFLVFWFQKRSLKKLESAFGTKLFPFLSSSLSKRKKNWKIILEALVLTLVLVAMARPQMGQGEVQAKSSGVELIIAVDVSKSMLAEDIKPSRLDHLRREMNSLLDQLNGDKVGLIAFAGSSALLSPLTTDYSSLKMFIDSISPESISTQGTIFLKALDEANSAFKRGGEESSDENKVTKVVLIASDGEDNEPGAIAAAKKYKDKGMRVFTIGFGTEQGGSIPVRDQNGILKAYKKNKQGEIVVTKAKSKLLKDLASAGGGAYYHATVGGNQIKKFLSDIDKLEKAEFEVTTMKDYSEYFYFPLALAVSLALIEILMSDRKADGHIWKGRFEVSKS